MSRVVKLSAVLALVFMFAAGAAASEPIELRIYAWWGSVQHAAIKKAADAWAKDHPGVTVEVLLIPGSTHGLDGLIANTAAGVPMDLVTLQTPFIQYATHGLLLPLDQLSQNGKWAIPQNYPESILDSFRYNGNVYGFPGAEAGVGMLLFYNVTMFEEIGWAKNQPPSTLEEMVEAHRKLSRRDPATGQLTQIGWNPYDAMPGSYFETIFGAMFNLDWFDAATQSVNLRAFEPLIEWGQQTYDVTTYQEIAALGVPRWTPGLLTNKVGMQINGSWVSGEIRNQYKVTGDMMEFAYTWVPTVDGAKATAVLPWGLGIPATSKHPELAYSLMDFLVSPEGMQILFDELGWLVTNLASLPLVNVDSVPEVRQAINMFFEADRVGSTPSLVTLNDVRAAIRDTAYYVWTGQAPILEAFENAERKLGIFRQ